MKKLLLQNSFFVKCGIKNETQAAKLRKYERQLAKQEKRNEFLCNQTRAYRLHKRIENRMTEAIRFACEKMVKNLPLRAAAIAEARRDRLRSGCTPASAGHGRTARPGGSGSR